MFRKRQSRKSPNQLKMSHTHTKYEKKNCWISSCLIHRIFSAWQASAFVMWGVLDRKLLRLNGIAIFPRISLCLYERTIFRSLKVIQLWSSQHVSTCLYPFLPLLCDVFVCLEFFAYLSITLPEGIMNFPYEFRTSACS